MAGWKCSRNKNFCLTHHKRNWRNDHWLAVRASEGERDLSTADCTTIAAVIGSNSVGLEPTESFRGLQETLFLKSPRQVRESLHSFVLRFFWGVVHMDRVQEGVHGLGPCFLYVLFLLYPKDLAIFLWLIEQHFPWQDFDLCFAGKNAR